MDVLEKCESLFEEFKKYYRGLEKVSAKLENKDIDYRERTSLYEAEFSLVIKLNGAYEDLLKYLDILETQEGMRFIANKIRKQVAKIADEEIGNVTIDF